jgi:hypothetical protein
MSTEREHAHDRKRDDDRRDHDDRSVGRVNRSAMLNAPEHPVTSGLIARKAARDDNGVEAGADQAIATAASSSGMSLPSPIMRKFEASLGADLSGVRVHTGAESQSAASAVGAKAYTMGQDIHFGAGHYDPSSSGGEHLLAHEVAHTVQQRGGAPSRMNKLEVSSPGDSCEAEADHAADAMVASRPTSVGGSSGLARQIVQREAAGNAGSSGGATPFDLSTLPRVVMKRFDQMSVDRLRPLTLAQINRAYGDYITACNSVNAKLTAKRDKNAADKQALVDITLGVAGMIVGFTPAGAAVGASLAPSATAGALDFSTDTVLAVLTKAGVDTSKSADVADALGNRIKSLLANVTPEIGKKLVDKAADKAAAMTFKINTVGSQEDKACSYVDALAHSADISSSVLLGSAASTDDLSALAAVCSQFTAATEAVYEADVQAKANNFLTQVAPTIGERGNGKSGNGVIVQMNAYGQVRLASVMYIMDSANYRFLSWVTPDMEAAARSMYPEVQTLDPRMIVGHIPDPNVEGPM